MSNLLSLFPIPPGWFLLIGAPVVYFVPSRVRSWVAIMFAMIALVWSAMLPNDASLVMRFVDIPELATVGFDVVLMQMSTPSRLFGLAFALLVLFGTIFAVSQTNRLEAIWAFIYAGCALSLVYAGDLMTFFVYWEGMALASALLIMSADHKRSGSAGMRYLLIHLLGGVLFLSGICAHIWTVHSTSIALDPLLVAGNPLHYLRYLDSPASILMLSGLLINAGLPIVTSWLQDAYPESSFSGAVFLSGMTTKAAIFALLMFFSGAAPLFYIGGFMVVYGIVYGLGENDLRRLLCFSIISQMGYMICVTGVGTPLSVNAVTFHALVHILYKALLMMSAGAVMQATGCRWLSRLGGLRHAMPWTAAFAWVGALTLAALPLTGGYHSKTLLLSALHEGHQPYALLLMAASAMGLIYVGLRFPWLVFMGEARAEHTVIKPHRSMRIAMGLVAACLVFIGVFPTALGRLFPYFLPELARASSYWDLSHLLEQLQMLIVAGMIFFWWLPKMMPKRGILLETDWLYRRVFTHLWCCFLMPLGRYLVTLEQDFLVELPRYLKLIFLPDKIDYNLKGQFNVDEAKTTLHLKFGLDRNREWSIGSTLLVLLAILTVYLGLFFWRRATLV